MKTAISVPAETAARRLRVSRSQLYSTALAEYLERQRASTVTERLNEVYSREESTLDPVLMKIQLASIDREPW